MTAVNKGTQVLLIVEAWSKSYYFAILFVQGIALFICFVYILPLKKDWSRLILWPFYHPFLEELEPLQKAFPISCHPMWSPKSSYCPHALSQRMQRHFFLRTVKLLCPSMGQFLLKKMESLCISVGGNEDAFSGKKISTLRKGLWVPKDHSHFCWTNRMCHRTDFLIQLGTFSVIQINHCPEKRVL